MAAHDKHANGAKLAISGIDTVGRFQVLQTAWGWIGPFAGPTVLAIAAAVSGYFQHTPVMWIIMATSMTFVCVLGAIMIAYLFQIISSPADKLRFVSAIVPCDVNKNQADLSGRAARATNLVRTIDKMQVGILVQNVGRFPISIILFEAETELDGITPPRVRYPKLPADCHPSSTHMLTDEIIDMKSRKCADMQGRLDMKVKYGNRGNEKYELHIKGTVFVKMSADGAITHTMLNLDTNQE
jgi:hypothetical protein